MKKGKGAVQGIILSDTVRLRLYASQGMINQKTLLLWRFQMGLITWSPGHRNDLCRSEIDSFCSSFFDTETSERFSRIERRWSPAMDLVDEKGEYVLRADLPGLKKEDVKVDVEDGVLTVSGERKSEHEEKERGYQRFERRFGGFRRSLTLPDGVDTKSISATVSEGVLEVRIPKPEERKPQRVDIEVSESSGTIEGSADEPDSDKDKQEDK